LYLSWFDFILKHIPGKSIDKVDGLSQRPDWQEGVENDNKDQVLVKPGWIKRMETLVEEGDLKDRIRKAQERDKKVVEAVKELKKTGMKALRDEEWTIEEELVMKEGQIYVLEGELRGEVIWLYHDTPVRGYGRRWKTIELVTRNYWWPGK